MYRALVADDETNIREGLSSLVEECGLKIKVVAQAQDGLEALAMFEKYSPDLVLMDINMPLMDGLSCIEKMKAMKENVRVVIVSSYDNFSYAKKAIGLKVDSYILKPIDEEELKQVLKKCSVKSANYHSLRHTFATRCIELGFDVKSLSEILGHASVNITMNRYVHPSMDLKRENMRRLSELIAVK